MHIKSLYLGILFLLVIFSALIFYYFALDTQVSLKYETDYDGCISQVSGINLCHRLDFFLFLSYSSFLISFGLIGFIFYRIFKKYM